MIWQASPRSPFAAYSLFAEYSDVGPLRKVGRHRSASSRTPGFHSPQRPSQMIFPLPSEISIRHPRSLFAINQPRQSSSSPTSLPFFPLRALRLLLTACRLLIASRAWGHHVTPFGFFSFFSALSCTGGSSSLAAVSPFRPRLRFPVGERHSFSCHPAPIPSLASITRGARFFAPYQAEYKALMLDNRENDKLTFDGKSHKLNSD